MRITLGNIDGKALGLNASEACVYAAIEKCSKGDNAKGWYGTMEALAGVLPCKINRMSVSRAIAKLLNLGLIIEMENKYFVNAQTLQNTLQTLQNTLQSAQNNLQSAQNSTQGAQNTLQNTLQTLQNTQQNSLHNSAQNVHGNAQNVQNDAQNVHENAQNVHENAQIVLPPNTPPINKEKMNEEIKEQPRADMRTRDGAMQQCSNESVLSSFGALGRTWIKISGAPLEFRRREISLWKLWNETSAPKRQAIIDELNMAILTKKYPEHWKDNPLFYLQDFPEPEPKDYNGARSLPNEPLVIAKHNDRAGLYTRREAELFGMNILKSFVP